MADNYYEVIGNKAGKYTGKHKVYSKGDLIPESEVFGDLEVAVDGQKAVKKGERDFPAIKPVLKKASPEKIAKAKAGKK